MSGSNTGATMIAAAACRPAAAWVQASSSRVSPVGPVRAVEPFGGLHGGGQVAVEQRHPVLEDGQGGDHRRRQRRVPELRARRAQLGQPGRALPLVGQRRAVHRVQQLRGFDRQRVPDGEGLLAPGGRRGRIAAQQVGVGKHARRPGRPRRRVAAAAGRRGHGLVGRGRHASQIAVDGGQRRQHPQALHLQVAQIVGSGQPQGLVELGAGEVEVGTARVAELGGSAAGVQQCLYLGLRGPGGPEP